MSVNIDMVGVQLNNSGDVRSFLQVASDTQSLTIGIIVDGNGPELYIEYGGTFDYVWPAKYNTSYTVHIERTNTDQYLAWNGTHSDSHSVSQTGRQPFMGSVIDNSNNIACNSFTTAWTNTAPWGVSSWTHQPITGYYLTPEGSNAFQTGGSG